MAVRHPFRVCATKHCCCCIIDPLSLHYVFAIVCIVINAFASLTYVGVRHWPVVVLCVLNFSLHLSAGVILFLGAIWRKNNFKLIYCWILFIAIFTVAIAFIVHGVYFLLGDDYCLSFSPAVRIILLLLNYVWLIGWDIYTPMVVLGTTEK